MGILLLAQPEPVPDCLERLHDWKRVCLLILVECLEILCVLTLVAESILLFCFALLRVEIAKAVLVKRWCMCKALHRRVEEAGIAIVAHWKSNFLLRMC